VNFLIIRSVCMLQAIWGMLLLLNYDIAEITALAVNIQKIGIEQHVLGLVMILASILAFTRTFWGTKSPNWNVLFFIPQQLLLVSSAVGALESAWLGYYPDGTIKPGMFIFADQLPMILLAMKYTVLITRKPYRDVTPEIKV
jgi:hypothetical protein